MDFFFGFSGLPADQGPYKMVKAKEWVIGEPPAITKLVPKVQVPLSIKVGNMKITLPQKVEKKKR